jgi:hypothetical protein
MRRWIDVDEKRKKKEKLPFLVNSYQPYSPYPSSMKRVRAGREEYFSRDNLILAVFVAQFSCTLI